MRDYTIYTGNSRLCKVWQGLTCSWQELAERLRTPLRTQETFAQYKSASKAVQGRIKDVGGFVGGALSEGVRSASTVLNRCILTMDADSPCQDFIKRCYVYLKCDFVIYSTHSHAPGSERYRLIIPAERNMSPEEYQAVSRRVAMHIDINSFDGSTYEPSRLMYWPSCSADGEYVYECQQFMGPLDVDSVLSEYADWRDCSAWPVSLSQDEPLHKKAEKQADPLGKDGVVGAFCRCYSITEAISEFLGDIYFPTGKSNRWTYSKGSTFGGLVVYENKFAFSNHGTDPAGGKLSNAFDLVRVHLFGDKDKDAEPETPNNRLPSYLAMSEYAAGLEKVRTLLVSERVKGAVQAFSQVSPTEEENTDWMADLELDRTGKIKNTASNVKIILNGDPVLNSMVYKDEFGGRLRMDKCPPWRDSLPQGETWQDCDDSGLRVYMENVYGITQIRKIEDGFAVWVEEKRRHPVREYLESLSWDGVPRLDNLLVLFLGAENNKYTQAVTRKAFTAAVTRIFRPGTKFDSMLVLVGPQGIGKSTIIQKMGGKWHTDSLVSVQGREGPEQIQGFWLVEMGELTAMRKAEETAVKQFLSKQEDSFRPAYARHARRFPRQCVFFGTTNVDQFLKDTTGNRRFWVIQCREHEPTLSVFRDLTNEVRDQIWAEAVEYFRKGEPLYLPPEIEKVAMEIQQAHLEESPYAGAVRKYLDMLVPEGFENWELPNKIFYFNSYDAENPEGTERIRRVCPLMIWVEALGGQASALDRGKSKEINEIIRGLPGWQSCRDYFPKYGRQRGYQFVGQT